MPQGLEKIIQLVKKTGDNCIILDSQGNPAYVITDFDKYENLALNRSNLSKLSENELIDKINNDVAEWKSGQDVDNQDNWHSVQSAIEDIKKSHGFTEEIEETEEKELDLAKNDGEEETDQKYYFEPID